VSSQRKYNNPEGDSELQQILNDEQDETNTVIENECDNDYTNLYRSFEVEEETEEMRRQREFMQ
jgi:hypothetical protein